MKMRANPAPPYSVLNPDTSSDSPSLKSKGVRLVSATQESTHKGSQHNIRPDTAISLVMIARVLRLVVQYQAKNEKRRRDSLISYEMV